MITAGIDVGFENIKVVIFSGDKVLARAKGRSGGAQRGEAAQELYARALGEAGLAADDVENVVATGQGKFDVSFASKTVTEPIAGAAAARFFAADAKMVMDAGADQVRVVPLKEGGKLGQLVFNQKCSAGLGTMLRFLSYRLEMSLDEISMLGEDAAKGIEINDGCIVFAELDALENLNKKVPREHIAAAANVVAGYRLNALLHDKELPEKGDKIILIGGLTQNKAVMDVFRKRSQTVTVIPEDAEFGCALGAAIKAAT